MKSMGVKRWRKKAEYIRSHWLNCKDHMPVKKKNNNNKEEEEKKIIAAAAAAATGVVVVAAMTTMCSSRVQRKHC